MGWFCPLRPRCARPPPPSKEPREEPESDLSLSLLGEMSRNETERVLIFYGSLVCDVRIALGTIVRVVSMTEPAAPAPKYTKGQREVARYAYRLLGLTAVLLLGIGTVTFHYLEGWSWVDAFYFSAVAGSTVGFGDLSPTTDASKLVSILYIFSSIGILGTFLDQRLRYHGIVRNQTVKAIGKSQGEPPT